MRLALAKTNLLTILFELDLRQVVVFHQLKELFQRLDVLGKIHAVLSRDRLFLRCRSFVISICIKICYKILSGEILGICSKIVK